MTEQKVFGFTAHKWMMAFLEILDGQSSWWEIQDATGFSEERCKELSDMFNEAVKMGWPEQ